ncbi:MFS transporter [Niastella yeongjuensis]|uniref:MFS transporter n=1 Tax=Niastella yeongjuensis TaxID=354355 RepID=A0A1V9E1A1_9BACT|nr:MFS transporter [Niastella yeongjuensis]OQP39907.1 MFS transporter [Niastella yeongjuensis]SEO09768.1 Predicted arabinose efflux permease, MFS family [Niastella yeongjuensis]
MSFSKSREKLVIPIMAVSAGSIVANLYYSQPILNKIAQTFGRPESQVGKISMLSQLGYGLGMFFLLPLGDKVNRKNLILGVCVLLIGALLVMARVENLSLLLFTSFLLGLFATPTQILLPMAAILGKENRGKTVGKVFSGILTGILGSRIISGWLADLWGWKSVFVFSAVLVLISCLLLYYFLPEIPIKFKGNYASLLKSTLQLVKQYKTLRQAALLGAFTFGIFCSFWTTLTFHLSGAPFHYSAAEIGMFGIIAIGGALVAPYFGKMADKGNAVNNLFLTVGMIIVSLIGLQLFPVSVVVLCLVIFFLDIGVQATQITNFTRIYSLNEEAHSRLNTVYMTTYFIGGAMGTFFGLLSWKVGGWSVALWQMLLWSIIALVIVVLSKKEKL